MKRTKFYVGISLVIQCISFGLVSAILWDKKKSVARALAISAGVGGLAGAACLISDAYDRKRLKECDCIYDDDYDDDFFEDDDDITYDDDDINCSFEEGLDNDCTTDAE